jgi:hypothetical protein
VNLSTIADRVFFNPFVSPETSGTKSLVVNRAGSVVGLGIVVTGRLFQCWVTISPLSAQAEPHGEVSPGGRRRGRFDSRALTL